jgi:nickel transport protein
MIQRLLVALALVLAAAPPAHAHKVSVYAYAEAGRIHAEAYFADGGRCAGCALSVYSTAGGSALASAMTDAEGRASVPIPEGTGALRVALNAGPGHGAEFSLSADEVGQALGRAPAPEAGLHAQVPAQAPTQSEAERLNARMDALRREVQALREEAERPGMTEIIGGIGYIAGLFGLWALMKPRKGGGPGNAS